jgi:hypothetical protein
MASAWPSLSLEGWRETCDTLHAHTQLLGKLAVALAPPEPELQHTALRLSTRGWETLPLPAPDGSGALSALLDLHVHEAVLEHSDGRSARFTLLERSVGAVTRSMLDAAHEMAGEFAINLRPQEVAWTVPLDEDEEHGTYDPAQVDDYFAAATQAAVVLADYRAPFRGRSTPVNAWWGSFDLAVSLFSGQPADPPSEDFIMRNAMDAQEVAVGWWPGDDRYAEAAFYGYAHPAPDGFGGTSLAPAAGHWEPELGEYVLDWQEVVESPDPHQTALQFARSLFRHACTVCEWDPALAATAEGNPPPVV